MGKAVALIAVVLLAGTLAACSQDKQSNEAQLRDFLKAHPVASDPPVAVMKRNAAGDAWLITVQGYADNQATCEQLIEPYNSDPSLSTVAGTYYCDPIR